MRRWSTAPLVLAALAAACADSATAPRAAPSSPELARASAAPAYLVTFRDGVTDVRGLARAMAVRGGFQLESVREHAARGFTAVIPPAFLDAVRSHPDVMIVEQDHPRQPIEDSLLAVRNVERMLGEG